MSAEVLKNIPKLPGIYVFKDTNNNIIYVGKAKCLYKRVISYFRRQNDDWKVQELIKEYATIEHIITNSETEALLLEAQLIGKYKPKYNVLLKSGNPFIYIMITNDNLPQLKLARNKKAKGIYFGPFLCKKQVRGTYEYLLRTLRLRVCTTKISQGCLDYHLNRCAGNCLSNFNIDEYKVRLELAKELLEGNYQACQNILINQIKIHNEHFEFEKSRNLNKYLKDLELIFQTLKTRFSSTKYNKDIAAITTPLEYKIERPSQALEDLQILLKLENKPVSIDCFDISHFQSSYIVGSCIRFSRGIPEKNKFRRFKIKTLTQQNDYAALKEIVKRRYENKDDFPDIILIDGGKGQLNAVKDLFPGVPIVSLAKREETLFIANQEEGIKLNIQTYMGQLLIALRDYAHHFAVSYHKLLRSKAIKKA